MDAEIPSPAKRHREAGPARLRAAILTVSDSRTARTDLSGDLLATGLDAAGHQVTVRDILPDEPDQVRAWLAHTTTRDDVDMILLNGGTGISRRDRTYEAVNSVLERTLPGFGELFRLLSFADIGAAAMASRAIAGTVGGKLVFCTPGSPAAVKLAMERLILPEARHLVGELCKEDRHA
jgi:molybdenum cofactor biosynthesis protein B